MFFWTIKTLHEKVTNYKIVGLTNLYNFDIKFNFIQDRIKKLRFIWVEF